MARYELISFDLCPFVQKSVIALRERGVEYDITYIDLFDKPAWFLEISPFGKVPVLKADDAAIFESSVINEFIEETAEGDSLHPADPVKRAHNRAWAEFLNQLNVDVYRLMVAADAAEAGAHAQAIREKFARIEADLGEGPWFNGDAFSLVDCGGAPPLQRARWCDAIAPSLKLFAKAPKVAAWSAALLERPSVQESTVPDIHDRFLAFLNGKGTPTRDVAPSWLGRLASAT